MITPTQSKMGRAALGWGVRDLARIARIGATTVVRFEGGGTVNAATMAVIKRAFEDHGIRFVDGGAVLDKGAVFCK